MTEREQPVDIVGVKVPCYVLEGERRVITVNGLQTALGFSPSGGTPRLVDFVNRITGNTGDDNALAVRLNSPIRFQSAKGGKAATGYDGDLIVDVCEAILAARRAGKLTARHHP